MATTPSARPDPLRKPNARYHHGDLRAALLAAVEATVAEEGLEGLSLRACARRAGVSPGAPAHHFRNLRGLLTEFAVEGFAKLGAAVARELAATPDDPAERLVAVGRGYVRAALDHPAHFRVMFREELLDGADPRLAEAGAYGVLIDALTAFDAARGRTDPPHPDRALLAWCVAHGFASLWLEKGAAAGGYGLGATADEALARADAVLRRSLVGLRAV